MIPSRFYLEFEKEDFEDSGGAVELKLFNKHHRLSLIQWRKTRISFC